MASSSNAAQASGTLAATTTESGSRRGRKPKTPELSTCRFFAGHYDEKGFPVLGEELKNEEDAQLYSLRNSKPYFTLTGWIVGKSPSA